MGLFSRKSKEEKAAENFKKFEEKFEQNPKKYGYLLRLFNIASTKEQYQKTANIFKNWAANFSAEDLPKRTHATLWDLFIHTYIGGLTSLMIIGEYEECLDYCQAILVNSDDFANINTYNNTLGIASVIGGLASGKNKELDKSMELIKLVQIACWISMGKEIDKTELENMSPFRFILYKDMHFNKKDEYFTQNFEYKDGIYAKRLLEKLENKQ